MQQNLLPPPPSLPLQRSRKNLLRPRYGFVSNCPEEGKHKIDSTYRHANRLCHIPGFLSIPGMVKDFKDEGARAGESNPLKFWATTRLGTMINGARAGESKPNVLATNLGHFWVSQCGEENGEGTAVHPHPRRYPIRTLLNRLHFMQGMRKGQGGRLDALVIIAARDIRAGEELLLDYDEGKKQHAGPGYNWNSNKDK